MMIKSSIRLALCVLMVGVAGVSSADVLVLREKTEIKKADRYYEAFKRLYEATMGLQRFAADVADNCAAERSYERVGLSEAWNTACGKPLGRLADIKGFPLDTKEAMNFVTICKGAYGVKKAVMKHAGYKVSRWTEVGGTTVSSRSYSSGTLSGVRTEDIEKYFEWCHIWEDFLKTRCDVKHPKHFRFISGDYTYEGKKPTEKKDAEE